METQLTLENVGTLALACDGSPDTFGSLRFTNTTDRPLDSFIDDSVYGLTQAIVQPGTTQVFALGDALHRQVWQISQGDSYDDEPYVATIVLTHYVGPSNCRFTAQAVVQNPDPFG